MAYLHDNEGYSKAECFPDLYSYGLHSLTTTSNEKQVAVNYLMSQRLGRRVLDIGAGNGEIARLLNPQSVDQYTAIERNPVLVQQLGRLGISVLEGVFPATIPDGMFDTVFASHSLPVQPQAYMPFIEAARQHVSPHGSLSIITFSDLPSPYATTMGEVGLPRDTSGFHVSTLEEYLLKQGDVHSEHLRGEIRTKDLDELIAAVAFVGSTNGNPEKMQRITDELKANPRLLEAFRKEDAYVFPLDSQAFTVRFS